jgi:hypothetical protein
MIKLLNLCQFNFFKQPQNVYTVLLTYEIPSIRIRSILQKHLDHFSSSCPMQRSFVEEFFRAHDARYGSVLEQQAHDLLVGGFGHDVERAVAAKIAGVDVGTGVDKQSVETPHLLLSYLFNKLTELELKLLCLVSRKMFW